MNKSSENPLVDTLIEAYVSWRETCLRVSDAYRSWTTGPCRGAPSAFNAYMVELDWEQRAAETYAEMVQWADQLVSSQADDAGMGCRAGHEPGR